MALNNEKRLYERIMILWIYQLLCCFLKLGELWKSESGESHRSLLTAPDSGWEETNSHSIDGSADMQITEESLWKIIEELFWVDTVHRSHTRRETKLYFWCFLDVCLRSDSAAHVQKTERCSILTLSVFKCILTQLLFQKTQYYTSTIYPGVILGDIHQPYVWIHHNLPK